MLLNDLKDSKSGIIDVPPELGSQAMDIILHHIYTGKIDPSCNQIIEEVVYGANMYNLRLRHAMRDVTNFIRM